MKLSNLISFYNPSLTERHQALKTVSYLNYGRLIRNEIIHQGEVKYDLVKEEFQFRFKPYSCNLKITFEELWKEICNAYNSLNLHLLKIKFPDLSWDIDTKKKMTHIATSVAPSKDGMVLIVANHDWREIFSYNHNLAQFTVPPEKFPVGIKTKDGKLVNLNIDHERGKYELIDQRFDKNGKLEVKFITFSVDISYEEFKKLQEEKNLAIFLGNNYYFHSCPNCDFIIPVHRHIEYQNDFCPKCKNQFNLREFEKKIFLNLYEKAKEENNFNKALIYIQKSIDIAPDDKTLWDNKSSVLITMKHYDLAIECCNHIIGRDKEFGNAYYNKSCAYALKKDLNNAISNLKIAIGLKEEYKTLAKKDNDFEFIKESTEFEEIIK